MNTGSDITAIVIGRNEGHRLIACLESLQGHVGQIVYVDSGSTDGSQDAANGLGAEVVGLDMSRPFTAARARNAGLDHVHRGRVNPAYVQFLDGDCTLQPEWIKEASAFLEDHANAAAVCGRRRERFPQRTIYNAMIDIEWNTPIGRTRSCGGDVLMRIGALAAVGGYTETMIAGEEPELCVRLRAQGWEVWRIDSEMTLHDAEMTRFSQWWQRARRAGYAYAEGFALHGAAPERHNAAPLKRTVIWGGLLPTLTIVGTLANPWALVLLVLWPLQILRLYLRSRNGWQSIFLTVGKIAEAQGVTTYIWRRLIGSQRKLIEYK